MKKAILLLLLLAIPNVCAYSIGVSPDKLVFDEDEKTFIILNPNDEDIDFVIENDHFEFSPQEGTITKKSSKVITAKVKDKQNKRTNILIKFKKDSTIIPGAVLKAEIIQTEEPRIDDQAFTWLLVFFSTIFFGFMIFLLVLEVIKWLRGG